MATIKKVPVLWGGIPGTPGYSVFYSTSAADVTTDLGTFFNAIKGLFPTGLTWQIPAAGDELDDATGLIQATTWTGTGATVSASNAATFAGGVGGWINWRTSAVVGRRRLMGRTFLVPLCTTSYDTGGSLITGTLTTLGTASATLAAAGKLVAWHRPKNGAGGSSALVTAATIPDQVTSLRTRRY